MMSPGVDEMRLTTPISGTAAFPISATWSVIERSMPYRSSRVTSGQPRADSTSGA